MRKIVSLCLIMSFVSCSAINTARRSEPVPEGPYCTVYSDGAVSGYVEKMNDGSHDYVLAAATAKKLGMKTEVSPENRVVVSNSKMQIVFNENSKDVSTNGSVSGFYKPMVIRNGKPFITAEYFNSSIFSAVYSASSGKKVSLECKASKTDETDKQENAASTVSTEKDSPAKEQYVELQGLRYGSHPEKTRVVLDLSNPCDWEENDTGDSFVLTIKGAVSKISGESGTLGKEVRSIKVVKTKDGYELRIAKSKTAGSTQSQMIPNPDRLVIDVFALREGETKEKIYSENSQYEAPQAENAADDNLEDYEELLPQTSSNDDNSTSEKTAISDKVVPETVDAGKIVIVIDAGHGGRFGGTYSTERVRTGTKTVYKTQKVKGKKKKVAIKQPVYKVTKTIREQDITLKQAKDLKAVFDKDSRFHVIMTRTADVDFADKVNITRNNKNTLLGQDLRYRCSVANDNKASAFISLHVNSTGNDPNKCSAQGFEILYRTTGNNDKGSLDSLRGETNVAQFIDSITMHRAKEYGLILATSIDEQMAKIPLHRFKAPYPDKDGSGKSDMILRCSRYPAVIVESGYLCNATDRKMLQDDAKRKKLVEHIYKGIVEYGKKVGWFK